MVKIILTWDTYQNQDWFKSASAYCSNRFNAIESRLFEVFRYIELHKDNGDTFSYELSSILRDCGSAFSSTMDAIVKGSGFLTKSESNFGHYRNFLCDQDPDIYKYSVQIRPLFPNGAITPFKGLEIPTDIPKWWKAYNEVKHNEHQGYRHGNLQNCINAISALVLIGHFSRWFVSDPLFVNVGSLFDENNTVEKRLFS